MRTPITSVTQVRRDPWDWTSVHRLALREACSILGPGADAEDAAQEATVRAWRRRSTCRNAPGPWLREIARNEALRVAGRRRDEAPLEALGEATAPGGEAHTRPDERDMRAAVGALEHGDRLLLLLRYWADLTQPEVAEATALPEGTVKVRLHRARKRLHAALSAA
jgi:RNA polymerase sigma-70 factor, ECF subfamily